MKHCARITPPFTCLIIAIMAACVVAILCAVALAADPVAAAAPPAPASFIAWFQANISYILGVALAISELLGVTPWFKGNGVLDSVVKSLKYLVAKTDTTPPAV